MISLPSQSQQLGTYLPPIYLGTYIYYVASVNDHISLTRQTKFFSVVYTRSPQLFIVQQTTTAEFWSLGCVGGLPLRQRYLSRYR